MNFGNLEIVEKTFTRSVNNPRGQDYEGIKFRRTRTKKGEGKEIVNEVFTFSDKLFAALGLENYALRQANTPDSVLLLVVEDQDEQEPAAKFMRQSLKKDGTKWAKTGTFSNEFVTQALIDSKILDEKSMDNQYLALQDITSEFPDKPKVVKSIHKIVIDDSVNEEQQEEAPAKTAVESDNF